MPWKTSVQFQPFDSGIITSVKSCYQHKQTTIASDRFEKKSKSLYHIDQLTAVKWIKGMKELEEELISNSWCSTGLIVTSSSVLKNSKLKASTETIELNTNLLNKSNVLLIRDEQDRGTNSLGKRILVWRFSRLFILQKGILIKNATRIFNLLP